MSDDQASNAEQLDDDVVGLDEDYDGDGFGDGVAAYPPDRPMGVGHEEHESFAERTEHEVPESDAWRNAPPDDEPGSAIGQLIDPHAASIDHDALLVAEESDGAGLSAEEAAMHIDRER